jgi:hypothetical protein
MKEETKGHLIGAILAFSIVAAIFGWPIYAILASKNSAPTYKVQCFLNGDSTIEATGIQIRSASNSTLEMAKDGTTAMYSLMNGEACYWREELEGDNKAP